MKQAGVSNLFLLQNVHFEKWPHSKSGVTFKLNWTEVRFQFYVHDRIVCPQGDIHNITGESDEQKW